VVGPRRAGLADYDEYQTKTTGDPVFVLEPVN